MSGAEKGSLGTKDAGFRPYMGLTFLIGMGFFTMGLMDPLYDTYLPIFLGRRLNSMGAVGAIMTLDNILAVFLIPLVSLWSDATRSRIGRRMPFIIVTIPLSALFFSLVPFASEISLGALVLVVFVLNLFKQAARGPVVALMPDIIPGTYRSEANGVINTMGGIATIVGSIGLARLMDLDIRLPILGTTKERLPFPLAGILVILATTLLFFFVHEKKQPKEQSGSKEKRMGLKESLSALFSRKDKSVLRILISLFLWFLAYQGVLPFIGKYGVESLGASSGLAALAAGMVGIAYALFAVPSGFFAHRLGRKRTIRWALAALAVVLTFLFFFLPVTKALGLTGMARLALFWATMFIFGMFWVTVITNSFPMLWQMADYGTVGIYTGLYYTFSQAAAITAPPLTGLLIDLAGYPAIFLFGALCMAGAWAVMGSVRSGEAEDTVQQA